MPITITASGSAGRKRPHARLCRGSRRHRLRQTCQCPGAGHASGKEGDRKSGQTGAVTLIQRFGRHLERRIARLASPVPKPRVYLNRYHGVFAPHSRWRAQTALVPAGEGWRVWALFGLYSNRGVDRYKYAIGTQCPLR
ncbi:MAG: hypothetical protein OEV14_00215 [Gammaproteobacteria bacterium]|nr:hypothetical protein [Gammaproteobacteria bacterium]